jgi:uncharacterized surface anchored protein
VRFSVSMLGKLVISGQGAAGSLAVTVPIAEANIKISLTDSNNTPKPLAGTSLHLIGTSDGGAEIDITAATGTDGICELGSVPVGTYTLEEVYPTGYIGPEVVTFTLTDKDGVSNPKIVNVENCPIGLKIIKVDAKSGNPLAGAGFCLKVKGESDFEILKLRKEADGSFFYDPNGTITDMITDGTGELVIYGLPLGEVWIEETVTPDGYFPISAQKVELTRENTNSEPLTFRIENHKFVKLGMDSDWWEFPALCSGVLLLLGGLVAAAIIVAKKRKRLREEV